MSSALQVGLALAIVAMLAHIVRSIAGLPARIATRLGVQSASASAPATPPGDPGARDAKLLFEQIRSFHDAIGEVYRSLVQTTAQGVAAGDKAVAQELAALRRKVDEGTRRVLHALERLASAAASESPVDERPDRKTTQLYPHVDRPYLGVAAAALRAFDAPEALALAERLEASLIDPAAVRDALNYVSADVPSGVGDEPGQALLVAAHVVLRATKTGRQILEQKAEGERHGG